MRTTRTLTLALFLGALSLAPAARADDRDAAKALFDQGVAAMTEKKYDEACPALEKSLALDPYPGTLFALADCEAFRGRAAAAFRRYGEYLEVYAALPRDKQLRQGTREKEATSKRAELEKAVAIATVTLPADAPAGTAVTLDGAPLAGKDLAAPAVLDPGEHVWTTRAPGGPETEQRVTLEKGEKRAIELEVRPAETQGPAPPPVAAPSGPSGRRVAAFVTGGVGVAGLVLGGVTGGLMLAQADAIHAGCKDAEGGVAVCTEAGARAGNDAKTFGLVATVGFAAGLALTGAAVVLFATEPRRGKPSAARLGVTVVPLGPLGAAAGVQGSF